MARRARLRELRGDPRIEAERLHARNLAFGRAHRRLAEQAARGRRGDRRRGRRSRRRRRGRSARRRPRAAATTRTRRQRQPARQRRRQRRQRSARKPQRHRRIGRVGRNHLRLDRVENRFRQSPSPQTAPKPRAQTLRAAPPRHPPPDQTYQGRPRTPMEALRQTVSIRGSPYARAAGQGSALMAPARRPASAPPAAAPRAASAAVSRRASSAATH